jgi:predicted amidohydrolase
MFERLLALGVLFLIPAAAPAQAPLVITHVNVVDVVKGGIQRDRTLVILEGKVSKILKGPALGKIPSEARVVDGSGKFLIPALWDMHQHFEGEPGVREFNLFVANGVLGVRNMGGVAKEVFRAREQTATGQVLGPLIVACGPIVDGPEPTNPPFSVSVHDAEEGRRTVQSLKAMGADCVKVHDGVPLDAYLAIAEEAKKVNLPLVGHVPVRVHVLQATNSGQRSIEHQIGLQGMSTVEDEVMESEKNKDVFAEAMRTKNFRLIPESIAKRGDYVLDHWSEPLAKELYAAFVRNGTYLDPTLVTDRSLTFVDEISKEDDPRLKYIQASQREWWNPERGMLTRYRTPAYIVFRKRQFEKTLQQIPIARRAGVMFLAGTDTLLPFVYPGFSVHDELRLFVQSGFTPLEALQTATINPARFLGLERSWGTVEPGKAANLVLLDADPLKDIQNTTKISAVIVRGRLLTRGDLDRLLQEAQDAAGANGEAEKRSN